MERRIVFWFALLIFLAAGVAAFGHGANYTPAEEAWMERQRALDGTKCCAPYDFHVIQDPQWRMNSGHYEVYVHNAWHVVPAGRLLRHDPTDPTPFPGQALLFRTNSTVPHVWCFYPPPLM